MWERKRSRLGLHTKSFKSSEALGAVMCRAVNWSWHSTAEKKNPERTSVSKAQKMRQWMQGAWEKGNTHRPYHLKIFAEEWQQSLCVRVFILTQTHMHLCIRICKDAAVPHIEEKNHPSQFLDSCAFRCSPCLLLQFGVEFGFIAKP